ncbi:MAG TPA: flagellar hook-associated protein FlgL [Burkholderiaceae bacterium]|nr:flagellar hook-associated protein FlgL [Burkholderiaceae bacterium]
MRVSTSFAYQNAIDAMNDRTSKLARTQTELSTGRKLLTASDDPMAAAAAERTRSAQRRIETQTRMNDFAGTILKQADLTLGQVTEVMQLMREGIMQAGNGSLSAEDRGMLATQFRGYRDELLTLANRPDGAGGYVFGGQGTSSAPFVDGASVTYQPQVGEQQVGLDADTPTSLDGRQTFMNIPNGASTQSVFDLLDSALAVLQDPTATPATVTATVSSTLAGIDVAIDRASSKRTEVGEHLRALDSRNSLAQGSSIELASQMSDLVDVDFAKAISDFQNNQTAMSAAMKTYSQISKMSLFDYL